MVFENVGKPITMMYDNIEKLKDHLKQIKFGILKTTGTPFLKLSKSLIVETYQVDHDGYLWCIASDVLPAILANTKGFAAQLKYVHKRDGLFIKVTGHATAVNCDSTSQNEFFRKYNISPTEHILLLKMKIEEVQYYKKRAISACTSFLQVINIFTFNKAVLDSGL